MRRVGWLNHIKFFSFRVVEPDSVSEYVLTVIVVEVFRTTPSATLAYWGGNPDSPVTLSLDSEIP